MTATINAAKTTYTATVNHTSGKSFTVTAGTQKRKSLTINLARLDTVEMSDAEQTIVFACLDTHDNNAIEMTLDEMRRLVAVRDRCDKPIVPAPTPAPMPSKPMLPQSFFTGGNATFTIEPSKEWLDMHSPQKRHFTYRVKKSKDGRVWFVSHMTGSDNEAEYDYLGLLNVETGEVRLTNKSQFKTDSNAVCIVRRVLAAIWRGGSRQIEDAGWCVQHENRCCRCGRTLTVPASVQTGIGPECESYVVLGLGGLDEVPCMTDKRVAKMQYAYWMQGLAATLPILRDACLDAGMSDEKADAMVDVTKKTMRKFKHGKALPALFLKFIRE